MDGRLGLALPVAVVLLVGLAAGPPAAAAAQFDIAVPDALDLPPRTVTVQEEAHTVDGTLRTDPGVARTVEVTAPDEVYRVYVYDSDQRIVEDRRGDGSGTFTFDFADYAPGSYALAINHDGDIEDVFPVVVSGYDVGHDAPARAEPGDAVEVTVDVSATLADGPPAAVTVVIADGAASVREAAVEGVDGRYTATVSTADLDAGTYTVWAVAQGDEQAFGHREVLGMSTPTTVELADRTPTAGTDGSGSGGVSPTATASPADGTPTTGGPPATTGPTSGRAGQSPDSSPRDVITPAARSPTPVPPDGPPDVAVAVSLLVAASAGVLLWRRR